MIVGEMQYAYFTVSMLLNNSIKPEQMPGETILELGKVNSSK